MFRFERIKKIIQVFSITGKYLKFSRSSNANIVSLKNLWANEIINHFKINLKIIGNPSLEKEPAVLIGNHISYLDIPVLMSGCPSVTFVSKKEIKSWPIIGEAATKAQTIFVDRSDKSSRSSVKNQIATALIAEDKKVAIFPSGTTSMHRSSSWKKGAFDIAQCNSIRVQPFRIKYSPLHSASYITQDNFLVHMYKIFKLKKIDVTLEFHEPVNISNSIQDCHYWKKWCEE